MKTALKIIIPVLIVAAVVTGIIIRHRINESKAIPEGIVGNTSGNINNRGRFCESDGYIYFANPYDSQKLYKMKSDGTEAECLTELSAEFINVYGDDIYFYQTSDVGTQIFGLGSQYGICHTQTNGGSGTSFIDKSVCNSLILYGPNLYYEHYDADNGISLYKASTKNNSKKEISKKQVFVSCPINGKFYCFNTENSYYLSAYNEKTDEMELAPGGVRAYNVTFDNNYLYFMNIDDNYNIYRMNLGAPGHMEKIVDEKVDTFNVYGENIFYQISSEDNPMLVHMNITSGNETVVAEGNYSCINCTSGYTFFYAFDDKAKVYSVPTSGGAASLFRIE